MKNLIYTLFYISFLNSYLYAQDAALKELIIYSSPNKNTNIFFSSSIKSGIVGAGNFSFGYSSNGDSKIGILKSTPGTESNLLVITANGNIYSFIVRFKDDISILNYFIKDNMAIGNETGTVVFSDDSGVKPDIIAENVKKNAIEVENSTDTISAVSVNNYQTNDNLSNQSNYQSFANKEVEKPIFYNRIYGSKNKITVKLKNIFYIENELYFSLILKNDSTLDYDINYLNFYIISRNKKRNTVSQTIPYNPLYVHNTPSRISAKEEIEVVFVYKKFTINENKTLLIELTEDNGERNVKLEIPNTFINNPN